MARARITLTLDYHPGVGLSKVLRILDLVRDAYGIRDVDVKVEENV